MQTGNIDRNGFAWPAVDPRSCESERAPCLATEDDRLILVTEHRNQEKRKLSLGVSVGSRYDYAA